MVCVFERLSITAQYKISFTQLQHKKLDVVHGLNKCTALLLGLYTCKITACCCFPTGHQ